MRIEYTNGQITDVIVNIPQLQERMTQAERVHVWGTSSTEAVGVATGHLETDNRNNPGTPITLTSLVDLIVSDGLLTSQRGAELKA